MRGMQKDLKSNKLMENWRNDEGTQNILHVHRVEETYKENKIEALQNKYIQNVQSNWLSSAECFEIFHIFFSLFHKGMLRKPQRRENFKGVSAALNNGFSV